MWGTAQTDAWTRGEMVDENRPSRKFALFVRQNRDQLVLSRFINNHPFELPPPSGFTLTCPAPTRNIPAWKAFLQNHIEEIAAVDFFLVPTIRLRAWFVFLVIEHQRRRVLHFGVTEHPTAEWAAQPSLEGLFDRLA